MNKIIIIEKITHWKEYQNFKNKSDNNYYVHHWFMFVFLLSLFFVHGSLDPCIEE